MAIETFGATVSASSIIQTIRDNLGKYAPGLPIVKEFLQNAEDAKASLLHVGILSSDEDQAQPLLFSANDAALTAQDGANIRNIHLSDKVATGAAIGFFGLGLKSIFHYADRLFIIGRAHATTTEATETTAFHYDPTTATGSSRGLSAEEEVLAERIEERRQQLHRISPLPWGAEDASWFSLWAPLRRAGVFQPIMKNYPGDNPDEIAAVTSDATAYAIAAALPMLQHIQRVVFWRSSLHANHCVSLTVAEESGRRRWRRGLSDLSLGRVGGRSFVGCIAYSESAIPIAYAGREGLCERPTFYELKHNPAWPMRRSTLDQDTAFPQEPHTAVYFVRSPAIDPQRGFLRAQYATFLPIGAPTTQSLVGPYDVWFTVHGDLFIDSGRTTVLQEAQPDNPTSAVQVQWNRTLLEESAFPLALPALADFVRHASLSHEETTALTEALTHTEMYRQWNPAFTRDFQWVSALTEGAPEWRLLDASARFLQLPSLESVKKTPWREVFPAALEVAGETPVVLANAPRISSQPEISWSPEQLARLLRPPTTIFGDDSCLDLFSRLVQANRKLIQDHRECADALMDAIRSAITQYGMKALKGRALSAIVSAIPSTRVVRVAATSDDEFALSDALATAQGDWLFLPDSVFGETDPRSSPAQQHAHHARSFESVDTVVRVIAAFKSDTSTSSVVDARHRFARALVDQAAPIHRWGPAAKRAKVFKAFTPSLSTGKTSVSWNELDATRGQGTLLVGSSEDWATALHKALPTTRVYAILQDDAPHLFPERTPAKSTLVSLAEVVNRGYRLGADDHRRDLLVLLRDLIDEQLMGAFRPSFETREGSYTVRRAIRRLLHGREEPAGSAIKLLWDASGNPLVEKLIHKICGAQTNDYWLLTTPLLRVFNPDQLSAINVVSIDRGRLPELLTASLAQKIDCSDLTDDECSDVLDLLRKQPDTLGALNIHRGRDGKRHRRSDTTYLADSGRLPFPVSDPLSMAVTVIERYRGKDEEDRRQIQARVFEQHFWDCKNALKVALASERPDQWVDSIIAALQRMDRDRSLERGDERLGTLATTPWLRRANGSPVAPEQVLYAPGLDQQLSHLVTELDSDECVISDVAPWSDHGVESETHRAVRDVLDRVAFLPRADVLELLADIWQRDEGRCIGISADQLLSTDDSLSAWIRVFQGAAIMPAADLIAQLQRDDRSRECIPTVVSALCAPTLSEARYVATLNALASIHEHAPTEEQASVLDVFCWYLNATIERFGHVPSLKPIQLLNAAGAWTPATQLCATSVEGIASSHILDSRLARIWQSAATGVSTGSENESRHNHHAVTDRRNRRPLTHVIRDYFDDWDSADCPPGAIGALLALVAGDDCETASIADDYLSRASRSREMVVRGVEWPKVRRYVKRSPHDPWRVLETTISTNPLTREEALRETTEDGAGTIVDLLPSHRWVITIDSDQSMIVVPNLFGDPFSAPKAETPDNLLIGNVRLGYQYQSEQRICLRRIDRHTPRETRIRLLKHTINRILSTICVGHDVTIDAVWEDICTTSQIGIKLAERKILDGLETMLAILGFGKIPALRELSRALNLAEQRYEEAVGNYGEGDEKAQQPKRELKEQRDALRREIIENTETQQQVLSAVRRKLTENQYTAASMLFELFQNADDAVLEYLAIEPTVVGRADYAHPMRRVTFEWSRDQIWFAHHGRGVNEYRLAGRDLRDEFPQYGNDLYHMLVLSASGKDSGDATVRTTGKFGLGFKSTLLVSKTPVVHSGDLGFKVVAGLLPKPLEDERHLVRQWIDANTHDMRNRTTVIFTPVDHDQITPEETDAKALARFRKLLPYLLIFAKRVRSARVIDHFAEDQRPRPLLWNPYLVADGVELGEMPGATGTRLLVARGDRGALLFQLDATGVTAVDDALPSLWVTSPTTSPEKLGFLINGDFEVDPGRSQISNSADNDTKADALGQEFGARLQRLYDADWNGVREHAGFTDTTTPEQFWNSLWGLVSDRRAALLGSTNEAKIARRALFGQKGALRTLYATRRAFPNGFPESHLALVKPIEARVIVGGALANPEILKTVLRWPNATELLPPTEAVTKPAIDALAELLDDSSPHQPMARLFEVVKWSIEPNTQVSPELADRLGSVITPANMEKTHLWESNPDERQCLLGYLPQRRLKTRAGTYAKASDLVMPGNPEWMLLESLAPDDAALNGEYTGPGLDFAKACRGSVATPTNVVCGWIRDAGTQQARQAAVRYLFKSAERDTAIATLKQGGQIAWILATQDDTSIWNDVSDRERDALLEKLGLLNPDLAPAPTAAPPAQLQKSLKGAEALLVISLHYSREAAIDEFNKQWYANGRPPDLRAALDDDTLRNDAESRKAWLHLLLLGSCLTMGRTKPDQHREFLSRIDQDGWLQEFAMARDDAASLITPIRRFCERSIDDSSYYYWIRMSLLPLYQFSRWLDDYVGLFLSLDDDRERAKKSLSALLNPAHDRYFQGTGQGRVPPLDRVLGIGASFVVREIARQGVYRHPEVVARHCFVASKRVRGCLETIGCDIPTEDSAMDGSAAIYAFIQQHRPTDPTFGGLYDIPIWLLAYSDQWAATLRVKVTDPQEPDDDLFDVSSSAE